MVFKEEVVPTFAVVSKGDFTGDSLFIAIDQTKYDIIGRRWGAIMPSFILTDYGELTAITP